MDEILNSYLVYAAEKESPSAVQTIKSRITLFLGWLSSKNLSLQQVDPIVINEYLSGQKARGHQHRSAISTLCRLKNFFRYARRRELVHGDPTEGVSCKWLDIPGGYPAYQGALRKILRQPAFMVKYRLPLFAPHWERYLGHLTDQGFSTIHLKKILVQILYFHDYLVRKRVRRLADVTRTLVDGFLHRKIQHQRFFLPSRLPKSARRTVENFLVYIRHPGFYSPPKQPGGRLLHRRLLKEFIEFCRLHQGLRPRTCETHLYWAVQLGAFLDRRGKKDLNDVALADLDAFIAQIAQRGVSPVGLHHPLGSVRSLFRYLYLHDKIRANAAAQLISPCRFRADRRPKYIPWSKVEQLLAGIDRHSARRRSGERDYAILALLAYHGLRAREVAGLRISDIDWEENSLLLRARKNGSTDRLPLRQETREALKDYLAIRRQSSYSEIFLTDTAPIKPLGDSLSAMVGRRIFKQFGRSLPCRGAYVLRHSFAKVLLDRGARLPEIATLLGHRRLNSTLAYTRIATEDLREVADNYADLMVGPEVAPTA